MFRVNDRVRIREDAVNAHPSVLAALRGEVGKVVALYDFRVWTVQFGNYGWFPVTDTDLERVE